MVEVNRNKYLLDQIYDLANVGHFSIDTAANSLHWSSGVKSIFEVKEQFQPRLKNIYEFFADPGQIDKHMELIYSATTESQSYCFEYMIITPKGSIKWVKEVCKVEEIDRESTLLFGIIQDITATKTKELKFQQYQNFISDLATDYKLLEEEMESVLPSILTRIAEILNLDRINIWVLKDLQLECLSSYDKGDINIDRGTVLKSSELPTYFSAIENNRIIVAEDAENHAAYVELRDNYIKNNKISSILDVSVLAYGSVRLVICFESTTNNRMWTNNEITFAGSVGDQVAQLFANDYKKKKEKHLLDSLKEKETLMMEIHHRVKNNLAIVSGLLQLQAFETVSTDLQEKLIESVYRIKVMANIHELLYRSDNFTRIDFEKNIQELVKSFEDSSNKEHLIQFQINGNSLFLNVNQAVPFSLIINEVITNAIKHAFLSNGGGKIDVSYSVQNDQINFSIKDNGVGLSDLVDPQEGKTLGMQLINLLTEQIDGTFSYKSAEVGTEFLLAFKKQDVKGSASTLL